LGVATIVLLHVLVFFWVPTESFQGVVQRIFYIHVPAWWITFSAFGVVALCSAVYLWLGDDRLDAAAVAAAEGGMVFCTIGLLTGPLWARVAWGAWWTWEPRLTLALLLWFIYLGYFLVRKSTENPEQGKRLAAVVGIIGVLDIPLIHISVSWLRSLHPEAVVLRPGGPNLDASMLWTLMLGLLSYSLIFSSLFLARYAVEKLERVLALRDVTTAPAHGVDVS
jgi:heme exporter protein C